MPELEKNTVFPPLETFVCKTLFKEDLQSACSNSKDFPKPKSTCVLFYTELP